jgi:nucleoid-associated protein Lsr2
MAQKITVALEDELDAGPADETVRFAIGGTEYQIDLSTTNARVFRGRKTEASRQRTRAHPRERR